MAFHKITTLTEFILQEERSFKQATGSFTLLMTQIENAAKIIASHIKETGLVDILGKTGTQNAYGEEVQKLDQYSNHLLIDVLRTSGQVHALASEELDKPIYVDKQHGHYDVFFDPLDGSSNIDTNIGVGTIFSIYHRSHDFLQPGSAQVAAGYILYGSSVIFVYANGHGVNGFTLDPGIGCFLLSHPHIRIPETGSIYSINEGYFDLYDLHMQTYLKSLKTGAKPYKLRYAGSMVADIHRTLLKGGIFLYPADKNNPQGKLRLMFEVNPMSYIMKHAGGAAVSNGSDPLTIIPTKLEQRVPIVLGSVQEVRKCTDV